MEEWENVIIFLFIGIFFILFIYLLKEWKQRCCLGGLSKRNSEILRAAAQNQASRRRDRSEPARRTWPTLPEVFGRSRNNAGPVVPVPPPPSFEEALKCPALVYVIEVEEPPPSYQAVLSRTGS